MTGAVTQETLRRVSHLMALDRRRMDLIRRVNAMVPDRTVAEQFEVLGREYEGLADLGEPTSPLYTVHRVRGAVADSVSWAARVYERTGATRDAVERFGRAADLYRELGDAAAAEECVVAGRRIEELVHGDVDASIARLQERVAATNPGTLEHAEALVELGQHQSRGGDNYAARETLIRAEHEVEDLLPGAGSGKRFGEAIDGLVMQLESGGGPAAASALNELWKAYYLRIDLSQALAQVFAEEDSEAARVYLERSRALRFGDAEPAPQQKRSRANSLGGVIARGVQRLSTFYAPYARGGEAAAADAGPVDAFELAAELTSLAAAISAATTPPERLLAAADKLHEKARQSRVGALVAVAEMRRAELLLMLDRIDEAVANLESVLSALAGTVREYDLGAHANALLARAHAERLKWADVSRVAGTGIDLVEKHRYNVSSEYMRDSFLSSRIELYSLGVRAAYELDDVEQLLWRAELSKSRSLFGYRASHAAEDDGSADEAFLRLCAEVDEARARGAVPDELLRRRRVLWDLRLIERRHGAAVPAFSLAALRKALLPNEAVIYHYWLDRTTLLVIAADHERVVPELRRIAPDVRTELDLFASGVLNASLERPSGFEPAARLFAALLPHETRFLDGKDRLFVSPHRVLHAIPFHVAEWDGEPLIERVAITYIPNFTSLLLEPEPLPAPHVLTLGIRNYDHGGVGWPELPHAVEEARAIADVYRCAGVSVTPLIEDAATEATLREIKPHAFSCLHLATHGVSVNADTPMESYLCLYSSRFDGLEIASHRLRGELVVLSACCSGQRSISGRGLEELPGDELFGLQAAFFAAGAQTVVGCLWPVHDLTAKAMMPALHERIAAGAAPDVALQETVRAHRASARLLRRKPYYWGAFFVSALGRPRPIFNTGRTQ